MIGEGLVRRLLTVRYGETIYDKINLFITALLRSFPGPLRHTKLWEIISGPPFNKWRVNINGVRYVLNDWTGVLVVTPWFEPWMWRFLRPKRGDVFLDVGAHVGKYALQVARIVGNEGLVIAIEPMPEHFKELVRNIRLNGFRNVIPLNIAAWKEEAILKLYLSGSGRHSVKYNHGLGFIKVKARPLDAVLRELNVNCVNWIKIDVEGAEYEVLLGLSNTLRRCSPKVIIEIWNENKQATLKLMKDLGFKEHEINGSNGYYYFEK
mgnify:CR=1 FL=1